MEKRKLLAVVALLGGLVTVSAFARPGGGCDVGGRGDRHAIERIAERLDLSADQRTSVRAIEDKYRPQLRSLRDRMMDTRKALTDATAQAAPDEAKLRTLADAQGKAMADMIVLRTRMFGEIRPLLTDAQRAKLRDLLTRQDNA